MSIREVSDLLPERVMGWKNETSAVVRWLGEAHDEKATALMISIANSIPEVNGSLDRCRC
jgi:hypothetical protein